MWYRSQLSDTLVVYAAKSARLGKMNIGRLTTGFK